MYVYDEEGLSRKLRESSTIAPGTTFLIKPTGHLLWVYISGDERADSDLKNTASAIAQIVMQEDLEFSIITVSFLLPGKLIERKPRRDIIIPEERGRGRDVTIHRDQLLELQTDGFIQNLAFDPDVKVLEEEIRRSGIIPECVEFAVELYFRFKADVSIYPDPSYFYTDSDMRTCAFTIFDILFGKDNQIKKARIAFRGYSRYIAMERENFEAFQTDDRDAILQSFEIVTFNAPHRY